MLWKSGCSSTCGVTKEHSCAKAHNRYVSVRYELQSGKGDIQVEFTFFDRGDKKRTSEDLVKFSSSVCEQLRYSNCYFTMSDAKTRVTTMDQVYDCFKNKRVLFVTRLHTDSDPDTDQSNPYDEESDVDSE